MDLLPGIAHCVVIYPAPGVAASRPGKPRPRSVGPGPAGRAAGRALYTVRSPGRLQGPVPAPLLPCSPAPLLPCSPAI